MMTAKGHVITVPTYLLSQEIHTLKVLLLVTPIFMAMHGWMADHESTNQCMHAYVMAVKMTSLKHLSQLHTCVYTLNLR